MGSGVNTILQANNKTRVARAEYRAAKAATANTNKLEVSKGRLAEFMREQGNKARVNAASKEYNYRMDTLSEELRGSMTASANTQLQLATARGALSAQSGFVGVGGSSVDLMDSLVGLQAEMDLEAQNNARELMASRGAAQAAETMANAYSTMDLSRTFGNFDYSQYIEPKAMKRRFGKLVGVAVATYFGGPAAGNAVADMAVGTWQASNGNFDGMNQSFDSAIAGGAKAFQQWGQRGGQPWGQAVAQGFNWAGASNTPSARVTQFGNNYDNFTTSTSGLGWF